jgi:hypothetical protein
MRPVVRAWLVSGIGVAALCVSASVAGSQTTGTAATSATRADLGEAYLRMDKAYVTASLTDSARTALNQQFDRATLRFFAGRSAEAINIIDSATMRLTGAPLAAPSSPNR